MVTSRTESARHLPLVPAAAFVLVWSSGYISGPAAVHAAAPFTVLGWRFVIAALLGAGLALALRRPTRMDRATLGRVAAVGFVMNAVQFGLMYVAFDLGLGATLASLFHALSPVLTALLAWKSEASVAPRPRSKATYINPNWRAFMTRPTAATRPSVARSIRVGRRSARASAAPSSAAMTNRQPSAVNGAAACTAAGPEM